MFLAFLAKFCQYIAAIHADKYWYEVIVNNTGRFNSGARSYSNQLTVRYANKIEVYTRFALLAVTLVCSSIVRETSWELNACINKDLHLSWQLWRVDAECKLATRSKVPLSTLGGRPCHFNLSCSLNALREKAEHKTFLVGAIFSS